MTTQTLPSSDTSFAALNESLIGEIDLEEDQYINSLPHSVLPLREKFLLEWKKLIKLCQDVADRSSTRRVTRSDFLAKKKEITSQVYNSLKQYTFELYKKELGGSQFITGEARDKVVADITAYLTELNGDHLIFNPLIQDLKTAQSKEVDFRNRAFKTLKRELLFKQLSLEEYTNSLELQVAHLKDRTEREIDKVRGEFSKKLADALVENTRLTAEIDDSTRANYIRKNLIADLEEKLKTKEPSSDDKTLLLTKSELESTKQEIEIHKQTISDLNNLIDQLKETNKDNVAQLNHNYKLLSANTNRVRTSLQQLRGK